MPSAAGSAEPSKFLVEIFLSQDQKGHQEAIKNRFAGHSVNKVRFQVFRAGHPPRNIAIGRNIPLEIARLAIDTAVTYNGGIQFLLPQERLSPNYIAIGTSMFDELFQIPIAPEDLRRLQDPQLTTDEFHRLYRNLTKEDQRPEAK